MQDNCPDCGRTAVDYLILGQAHPKTKTASKTYPFEYDRDDYEVVIDDRTGYVVREPVEYDCSRGHEWVGERQITVATHARDLLEDQDREWPPSPDHDEPQVYGDDADAFDYDTHLDAARREYDGRVTDRTSKHVEAGRAHRIYDDATYKFTITFDSESEAAEAKARFRDAGYYVEEQRDERYSAGVNPTVLVVVPTGEATPIDEGDSEHNFDGGPDNE